MIDNSYSYNVDDLIKRYPRLDVCKDDINEAFLILLKAAKEGKKILIAGNGGSCSDANHIVGELAKSFKKNRPISEELKASLLSMDQEKGSDLASKLEDGIMAIALDNHQSLNTAFGNDIPDGAKYCFAQQVNVYGREGDVFLGISTSGSSKNVCLAAMVAKAKGMKVIGLTGGKIGELAKYADVTIKAPESETFKVQELHLPIYHCLCLMLEEALY